MSAPTATARVAMPSAGHWTVHAMGTVFSLRLGVLGACGAEVAADVATDLDEVERTFSPYLPTSEVSRIQAGGLALADASDQVRDVARACADLERRTDGAFSAWWDDGQRFDPTGYVKGWALARAARILARHGAYCLAGGGDVVAQGLSPSGRPWQVGVAHPVRRGELATVVAARSADERLAVATSGTSERGRHVVHPRTGWRPERSQVTAVGRDIATTDAAATAILALGGEGRAAQAALAARLGVEILVFDEAARPWWTPGMAAVALLPA